MRLLESEIVDDLSKLVVYLWVLGDAIGMSLSERYHSFLSSSLELKPSRAFRGEEQQDNAQQAEQALEQRG